MHKVLEWEEDQPKDCYNDSAQKFCLDQVEAAFLKVTRAKALTQNACPGIYDSCHCANNRYVYEYVAESDTGEQCRIIEVTDEVHVDGRQEL